jgi:chromate transport protein ChrA
MLLPGPEAQQLAAYIGWFLHGIWGGVAAGALFVLPAAVILWALSWLYMAGGNIAWVAAVFYGLQPAVVAIVAAAILRIGGKALKNSLMVRCGPGILGHLFRTPFVLTSWRSAAGLAAAICVRPFTAKDRDGRSRDSTGHEPWPSEGARFAW